MDWIPDPGELCGLPWVFSLGIYVSFIQQLRDAPSAILECLLFLFPARISPLAPMNRVASWSSLRDLQATRRSHLPMHKRCGMTLSGSLEFLVFQPFLLPRCLEPLTGLCDLVLMPFNEFEQRNAGECGGLKVPPRSELY